MSAPGFELCTAGGQTQTYWHDPKVFTARLADLAFYNSRQDAGAKECNEQGWQSAGHECWMRTCIIYGSRQPERLNIAKYTK